MRPNFGKNVFYINHSQTSLNPYSILRLLFSSFPDPIVLEILAFTFVTLEDRSVFLAKSVVLNISYSNIFNLVPM